jgi:fumarate reductase flavoprotein subunit
MVRRIHLQWFTAVILRKVGNGKKTKDELNNGNVSRRSVLKGAVAISAGLALNMAAPGTAEAAVRKLPATWDET